MVYIFATVIARRAFSALGLLQGVGGWLNHSHEYTYNEQLTLLDF